MPTATSGPPRKKKAAPLQVPAIVRRGAKSTDDTSAPAGKASAPAIVTVTSKRARINRRREEADDNTEASPEIKAFFARMMRPRNRLAAA
jgi:hypothetical protein